MEATLTGDADQQILGAPGESGIFNEACVGKSHGVRERDFADKGCGQSTVLTARKCKTFDVLWSADSNKAVADDHSDSAALHVMSLGEPQ